MSGLVQNPFELAWGLLLSLVFVKLNLNDTLNNLFYPSGISEQ
jgi:hypothetical protein